MQHVSSPAAGPTLQQTPPQSFLVAMTKSRSGTPCSFQALLFGCAGPCLLGSADSPSAASRCFFCSPQCSQGDDSRFVNCVKSIPWQTMLSEQRTVSASRDNLEAPFASSATTWWKWERPTPVAEGYLEKSWAEISSFGTIPILVNFL